MPRTDADAKVTTATGREILASKRAIRSVNYTLCEITGERSLGGRAGAPANDYHCEDQIRSVSSTSG